MTQMRAHVAIPYMLSTHNRVKTIHLSKEPDVIEGWKFVIGFPFHRRNHGGDYYYSTMSLNKWCHVNFADNENYEFTYVYVILFCNVAYYYLHDT